MKTFIRRHLWWLARRVLARHQPVVVAVAGSVGKTATKEAIAAGLSGQRTVRKTAGNFNAEIGVPVTIISGGGRRSSWLGWLGVVLDGWRGGRPAQQYPATLVLELGADHPGDLSPLIDLAQPSIGVLTSVAPEHLEFFGDERAVVAEESLVVRRLPATATAIVNIDDPEIASLARQLSCRVITFGWSPQADIRADHFMITRNHFGLPDGQVMKVAVAGSTIPIATPGVIGRHQAYPLLAALAVGQALGDDPVTVSQGLSQYQSPPGRMRIFDGREGSLIIDDSYNASPAAMDAALHTVKEISVPGRTFAILGQMSELGAAAARWHDHVGQSVVRAGVQRLVTVGPLARRIGDAAVAAGMATDAVTNVATAEAAAAVVEGWLSAGDAVIIKGSRFASRLERAVKILLAHPDRDEQFIVHSDEP